MLKAVGTSLSPAGAVVNNASISWDLAKVKTVAASVFKGAFAGMLAGAAVGAGTGAAIGFTATLLGGGIGALPGAIIGAIIGGGLGAIAGGIYGFRSGREEVLRQEPKEKEQEPAVKDVSKQDDSEIRTAEPVIQLEIQFVKGIIRGAIDEGRKLTDDERAAISDKMSGREEEFTSILNEYYEHCTSKHVLKVVGKVDSSGDEMPEDSEITPSERPFTKTYLNEPLPKYTDDITRYERPGVMLVVDSEQGTITRNWGLDNAKFANESSQEK